MNLGKAEIYPRKPIVAGLHATLTYAYTVGHCIDDSGFIKIAFRKMEDFGQPQFDNPISICVKQEDGHMGWSSPIYLVR